MKGTAYHEAAHTIVGHRTDSQNSRIYGLSIKPSRDQLGYCDHNMFPFWDGMGKEGQGINVMAWLTLLPMYFAGHVSESLINPQSLHKPIWLEMLELYNAEGSDIDDSCHIMYDYILNRTNKGIYDENAEDILGAATSIAYQMLSSEKERERVIKVVNSLMRDSSLDQNDFYEIIYGYATQVILSGYVRESDLETGDEDNANRLSGTEYDDHENCEAFSSYKVRDEDFGPAPDYPSLGGPKYNYGDLDGVALGI